MREKTGTADMRIGCFRVVRGLCAMGPISRAAWLNNQRDAAMASAVFLTSPSSSRDPALVSAYDSIYRQHLCTCDSTCDADHGVGETGSAVSLELPQALALIRAHGAPILDAVKKAGSFLYRGATFVDDGRPRLSIERPDLLDEGTYGSATAAEYFGAVDAAMAGEFRASARPSTAHIMVSDKSAAAEWGTACSVWPLGDSLDFSWLDTCEEWWRSDWDQPNTRSVEDYPEREAFFWRNGNSLRSFLEEELKVDTGLPEAIRRRHEVLVRSGKFSIETRQAEGIKGQDIIVCDAFVCIPASFDHAVGWSLGVKAIRADSSERRA